MALQASWAGKDCWDIPQKLGLLSSLVRRVTEHAERTLGYNVPPRSDLPLYLPWCLLTASTVMLQLAATGLSIYLTRYTRGRWAWYALAFAMGLMSGRRIIVLGELLGPNPRIPQLSQELIAFAISALSAAALWKLRDYLLEHLQNEELVHALAERAETAARLVESELRYRTLFEQSGDYVLVMEPQPDGSLLIVDSNDAASVAHGYSREELVGHPISLLDPHLTPEVIRSRMATLERRKSDLLLVQHRRKDDSLFDVEVRTSLFKIGGRTLLLSSERDVTARQAAEEIRKQAEEALLMERRRLANILEGTNAGTWAWKVQTGEVEFNERWADIIGTTLEELEPISIDTWTSHVHPDDLPMAQAALERHWKGQTPYFDVEFRQPHQAGGWVWVNARGKVVEWAEDGRPLLMSGTHLDITAHKQAEADRHQLQTQLQHAQRLESLGILAGGVAHDMNNVLGAIIGLASANLRSQPEGSPALRAFGIIIKAAERGGKMVRSLLGFARTTKAEEQELNLNDLLEEQVDLLERTTLAKVTLQLDLAPDLESILGDPSALAHAIMNLCVNAVDAMPEGGSLILRTRNVDSDWIEVQVEDTGLGMPQEVLARAMDPFYTTKGMGKGTGLGLSMVYSTVKAHQGQITLQSEPGRGTCIRMRFPSTRSMALPKLLLEPMEPALCGVLSVLVIDDDEFVQAALDSLLEALGHRVQSVSSGEAALGKLEAGLRPDLVIMDMNMPGLGGSGTLPHLRAICPALPVLLATGRADQSALDLVAADPKTILLSKPFSMDELRAKIEVALTSRVALS